MSFLETPRFPEDIAYGSRGGPSYSTTVIVLDSGFEQRNANWANSRHKYDVQYGIRRQASLDELVEFFHAVHGRAHGFRFKDWGDYKSCDPDGAVVATDQSIGTGNGSEQDFQLIKTYTKGALSRVRTITKPVTGSVVVAKDGVPQGSGWTVDTTTGIVSFTVAPAGGVAITAGYEFDVPVRFSSDELIVELEAYLAGNAQTELIEIRI